jgi:hypothetical protein
MSCIFVLQQIAIRRFFTWPMPYIDIDWFFVSCFFLVNRPWLALAPCFFGFFSFFTCEGGGI